MDIFELHTIILQVLDMCAAPGSKTAQLIEMMDEGCENELPSKKAYSFCTCWILGWLFQYSVVMR